jgi:uncharacterized membrane protein
MSAVTHEILVNAPISRVFEFWKNFENFPRFMENIESVKVIGPELTHWKMHGPLGIPVEWDAKTTYIEENKKISWQSTGGVIHNHGSVVFEPVGDDKTRVTVGIEYKAPGGAIAEGIAKLLNNPEEQLKEDMRRFKSVVQEGDGDLMSGATSASGQTNADHTAEA